MNTMFFNVVSCFFIYAGLIIALILAANIIFHRQSMKIMNIVWVFIGLWGHYFALFAYHTFGIQKDSVVEVAPVGSMKMDTKMSMEMDVPDMRPKWQSTTLSVLHCGAGCMPADLTGEWFTYWVSLRIGGGLIAGSWVLDFVLALVIGVFFQSAAIRGMEKIPFGKVVSHVFKADSFSLLVWQAGMYSWMAVVIFVPFTGASFKKTSRTFWFTMQIATFFGFTLSYLMNVLLAEAGIEKGM